MSVRRRLLGLPTGVVIAGSTICALVITATASVAAISIIRVWAVLLAVAGVAVALRWGRVRFFVLMVLALRRSRQRPADTVRTDGIRAAVSVAVDARGVPSITAATAADAWFALGFSCGCDRAFQMDLARREPAGRLAELFGPSALEADRLRRRFALADMADTVVIALPAAQRVALDAYSAGVNAAWTQRAVRPFECALLAYDLEPWQPRDCVLVLLRVLETLAGGEETTRMLATMRHCLPADVVDFLTPDVDPFDTSLSGESAPTEAALPLVAVRALMRRHLGANQRTAPVVASAPAVGSNCWAVAGVSGAATLANDTHLPLTMPNSWYRARLQYEDVNVCGVCMPGFPGVIAGSNTHVAWGLTNACLETIGFVGVEPGAGLTEHRETIAVRGQAPVDLIVTRLGAYPVLPEPLLGRQVAVAWTALVSEAVRFNFLDLPRARSSGEAAERLRGLGAPPVNVLCADRNGSIAHVVAGAGDRSRVTLGSSVGRLINANNKVTPDVMGQNYSSGCRARRIADGLSAPGGLRDEAAMAQLQLDTRAALYDFYRNLALPLERAPDLDPPLRRALAAVRQWDGRADPGSRGLVLLMAFRQELASAVLGPLLSPCLIDERFRYQWHNMEAPLRTLLATPRPEVSGDAEATWEPVIASALRHAGVALERGAGLGGAAAQWGHVNRGGIRHPLGALTPALAALFDLGREPMAGCLESIRAAAPGFGATFRMVVRPGAEDRALFAMPGGQSEHPLSRHYDDHHAAWTNGRSVPFLPGPAVAITRLLPSSDGVHLQSYST